ncbi:hypothetical protein MTO96_027052, partial [Rhipicephalus appendiculatus]
QFEPFRKGPKKLKWTAVPTLFLHCADKKKRKPPKKREVDSRPATSPIDSVFVATSCHGCPSDHIDSSSATSPADSVLVAASNQGCPSDQIDSSSVSCPADSVLVAASSQGCPSDEIDSSSASCPADSVLVAASSQGCPSDQIDSSSVSCPADSVLVAASSQGCLSDEIDSSSATSPADSVLVAASNQGRPSDQAAHLMVTKFAITSHPLGTCFRETSATASRSAATHEPLSVTSQQVSPRKKVADLQRKVKRLQRKNRDLLQENARIKKGITRVFTEDQVRALGREKNTGCAWSAATIKNALRLHFACGSTGYNLLISQDDGVLSTKARTTAWFFKQVNKWFDLMCSRHIGTAFSYSKPEEYDKAVSFMLFFMNLFRDIKIADGSWKPVQTGVLLSTTSILSLQKDLLKEGYKFVLTARFTQDSLENLFSMIRARNPIPTPYQCKMALRVISVSQYLKHAKKGSYDIDDGAFFLADYRSKFPESVTKVIEGAVEDEVDDVLPEMSSTEESAFLYMSGYLASSVLKNNTTCNLCKESIVDSQNDAKCVQFIRSKAYKDGCLAIPSQSLVSLLQMCESIFVKHASSFHKQINNAKRLQGHNDERYKWHTFSTVPQY